MSTWNRTSMGRVIALAIVGGTVGILAAQQTQPRPPAQPGTGAAQPGAVRPGQPPAGGATAQNNDHKVARWLNVGNKAQLELAKMAQDQASNEKVKELANSMVEDHQKFSTNLQKFISGQSVTQTAPGISGQPQRVTTAKPPLTDDAPPVTRNPNAPQPTRSEIGAAPAQPLDFVAIKEQVCDEVLKEVKDGLKELKGAEFDKAFIGMQVGMHHEMIATAKAVRAHVSRDFQAMLDDELEYFDAHLDKAKEICEDLRGQKGSDTKDLPDTKRQPEKDGR